MKAVPRGRAVVFFAIAGLGCLLDLATKHWIFAWLPLHHRSPIWKNVCYLETTLNEGALFGLGQGFWVAFSVLSVAAIAAILYWLFFAGFLRDWLLTVALGSITAGILGNLYDRLGLHGLVSPETGKTIHAVRDWILVYIGSWPWPNFNVADSMLVAGAILLGWHVFRYHEESQPASGDKGQDVKDKPLAK